MPRFPFLRRLRPILDCLGVCGAGLLYACALKYFVFPAEVILTGFEGIAAATGYFFGDPRLFLVIYIAAQAVLAAFAFFKISRTFAVRTMLTVGAVVAGLAFLPALEFANPEPQNERILLVLFGGILAGLAKALSLRLRGSTGDEDILGAWFAMKYLKPVGNVAIAAAAVSTTYGLILAFLKSGDIEPVINTLMYTAIYIFTSAETLNNFFRKFKLVVLTTFGKDPATLGRAIVDAAPHRTYTIQEATGGFSSESIRLVRTVITHEELPVVLDLIRERAPDAFWFHHDIEGISSNYEIKPIG
ncbi:YitT family protein [Luteolibacter marinus]|uniref:YitT family protein n=1 Tax=Luteolibacter marinus TaxID=2776705 RepID=UPI0031BB35E2